jgi:hypothetical protein
MLRRRLSDGRTISARDSYHRNIYNDMFVCVTGNSRSLLHDGHIFHTLCVSFILYEIFGFSISNLKIRHFYRLLVSQQFFVCSLKKCIKCSSRRLVIVWLTGEYFETVFIYMLLRNWLTFSMLLLCLLLIEYGFGFNHIFVMSVCITLKVVFSCQTHREWKVSISVWESVVSLTLGG